MDRLKSSSSHVVGSEFSVSPAPKVPRERSSLPEAVGAGPGPMPGEPAFSFAGFRLEADGTLLRGEAVVHLPPKELAALRFLLAHPGQIVTPMQLREAIWGNVHVTADSVLKCVSSLRVRLEPEECIQTVYKRGYRLSAEVHPAVLPHGVAPAGALPRLAIPPFATEFGIPEYLGHSVAEETTARLSNAHNPAVTVLARDSVFTLARHHLTAQQIGETLKADLVLTGTLRALPSHFRLRAEMIRVEDGAQIWVEDLLVDRSRIAGLESELVNLLAFRLGNTAAATTGPKKAAPGGSDKSLSQDRQSEGLSIAAVAAPTPKPESGSSRQEAYEIYQQGRYEWQTLERHRMQDGLQHLYHATELDPSLIAAKVDLVHLCVTQAIHGFMSPAIVAEIVRRTAESDFNAPDHAAPILPAVAWVNFHVDRDLPAALWALSRSAHLPHDPWITHVRAMFSLSRYRFAEAIAMLRAALQQDPYAPWLHSRLAWAFHLDGQAEESVRQTRHALALFPDNEGAAFYGAMILACNGEAAHAAELAQNLVKLSPYFDLASAVHAYALACDGRPSDARAILERLQWMSRERFVLNAFNAAVHVALGDHDAAIAELRTANQIRCPWFFQMLADPRLKPLHGHPEFDRMLAILTCMEAAAAENPELQD